MLGIHAVLIGPQLGAGIRTIGVNGKACNNLGIGDDNSKVVVLSVICFSNLNSSLTGSRIALPLVLKVQPSNFTSVPPQVQMEYWLAISFSKVQSMKVALP